MKKLGILAIISVILLISLLQSIPSSKVKAASWHSGTAPPNLKIDSVVMSDYNIRCAAVGGQNVDICVTVKNTGATTITEDFYVWIFVDQVTYLKKQLVTENIHSGSTYRVHFYNVHINAEIGTHTLDAYINDDSSTRKYCTFKATLTGLN